MIYGHLGIRENLLFPIYLKINTLFIFFILMQHRILRDCLAKLKSLDFTNYRVRFWYPLHACICSFNFLDAVQILDIKTLFY